MKQTDVRLRVLDVQRSEEEECRETGSVAVCVQKRGTREGSWVVTFEQGLEAGGRRGDKKKGTLGPFSLPSETCPPSPHFHSLPSYTRG